MHSVLKTAMASALALAAASPVAAQPYDQPQPPPYAQPYGQPGGTPYRPTDQYQQQQRNYQAQQDAYRGQRADYWAARADYDRQMADWEGRRAAYDARYGYGAYARVYGPAPVWDDHRWADRGPPPPADNGPPAAGAYGANTAYAAPVQCNNNSAVTAGLIGALAGGVLGSNVAGHGNKTGGTVLGALVGGGAGAAIGHANDKYKCDQRGAYWSYNDTVPYQVDSSVYRDDHYADYSRRGCRLAPAPVNSADSRYVRVCPDADGRYRVTG
jgi:uncharacterized protein YcfJ